MGEWCSALFCLRFGSGETTFWHTLAERAGSYAFYEVDVWIKSFSTLVIAVVTLIVLIILAWRNGRTYCNTICPVGTVLGFISRYSIFKPVMILPNVTDADYVHVIVRRPVLMRKRIK